jgi:hypothetical protein
LTQPISERAVTPHQKLLDIIDHHPGLVSGPEYLACCLLGFRRRKKAALDHRISVVSPSPNDIISASTTSLAVMVALIDQPAKR